MSYEVKAIYRYVSFNCILKQFSRRISPKVSPGVIYIYTLTRVQHQFGYILLDMVVLESDFIWVTLFLGVIKLFISNLKFPIHYHSTRECDGANY